MAVKKERVRLLTPTFRASFTDVFQKRAFQGQSEENARYACTALFSGFKVEGGRTLIVVPTAWPEKDQAKWKAILAECNRVSIEAFKKPMKDLDRAVYKIPFHRGEEKEYPGYGPGIVYFTMSAKNVKPQIVGRDMETPLTAEEFYPGCYARASVTPFAFDNIGKGIALGLNHIQKIKDGERLDSFRSAAEDFSTDPAEFEDAGEDAGASAAESAEDFA